MTGLAIAGDDRSRRRDAAVGFVLFVTLQILLMGVASTASLKDPFSVLLALALASPFLALCVLLLPGGLILIAPLLIVIPGAFLGFAPFEWILLAGLLGLAVRASVARGPAAPLRPLEIVFGLYVLWTAFTVSQAFELASALRGVQHAVIGLLAFGAGTRFVAPGQTRILLRMLAMVSVLAALHLLLVVLVNGYSLALLTAHLGKLTDLGWGRSNYVAAVAALSAATAIALTLFGTGGDRLLGGVSLLSAIFCVTVTLSRGGTVTLAIILVLALLLAGRRQLATPAVLLLAAAAAYGLSPLGQASLERFLDPTHLPSVGIRFLFYREAWIMGVDHWLLGGGPNQIPFHSTFYLDPNPHNFFLKTFADLGVVGTVLFLTLLGGLSVQAVRFRRRARTGEQRLLGTVFVLTLVAGILNSSVEPTLTGPQYSFLFWLSMGALSATCFPPNPGPSWNRPSSASSS